MLDWLTFVIALIPLALAVWVMRKLGDAQTRRWTAKRELQLAEEAAYFEPKLAHADGQLSALSTRMRGSYRRGKLDWAGFAGPGLYSVDDSPPTSLWREGSQLQFEAAPWQVDVTFGVEPLRPNWNVLWYVLVPRVTVKPLDGSAAPRLNRFAANYSIDSDRPNVAGRLELALFAGRGEAMSAAVSKAQLSLRKAASTIKCDADRVEVIGRPRPWDPAVSRGYGHGYFELESQQELIQQTLTFVQAIAKA